MGHQNDRNRAYEEDYNHGPKCLCATCKRQYGSKDNSANASSGSGRIGTVLKAGDPIKCGKCGKPGHTSVNCRG